MKWPKKVKAILSAPGRKISEVKDMSNFIGLQVAGAPIRKMVDSKYHSIFVKVDCAARACEIGVIGSESKDFFSRKILRGFFSVIEYGEDKAMKDALGVIVDRWKAGVVEKSDAIWLRETFVPFLRKCQERDLNALGKGTIQNLIVGGKVDVGSEKEGEPEQ